MVESTKKAAVIFHDITVDDLRQFRLAEHYKRHCRHARKLDEGEEGSRGLGEALTHLVTAWSNVPHIPVGLGLQCIDRYISR